MKIKSILTILDKPKHTQTALAAAAQLQQLTDAQMDLIAIRYNAMYDHDHLLDAKQRKELRHQLVVESDAWMAAIADQKVVGDKTRMRTIWTNDIAEWLADEVQERPVDLVVKSLHMTKAFMYTPTDWQILRSCQVPVLLKSTAKRRKTSGVILAALDFSRNDAKRRRLNTRVMQAATAMAQLTGAKVNVIYAMEFSQVLRDLDIIDAKVSKKKMLERIMPDVNKFLAPYDIPRSRMHFPVGKAGQVINSQAHKLNADMLVIGSGVHRVRQAVGLGSTAERVLTRVHRDVLTVHP